MRTSIIILAALAALAMAPTSAAQTPSATTAHEFTPAITAGDFAAHLKVLSSDRFAGREPGTEGGHLTTQYLIEQFKRMGLEPGNHGKWLQAVPAVSTTLTNTDTRLAVDTGEDTVKFDLGEDFMAVTLQQRAEVDLKDSEMVFAGYGVTAPARNWNDYAGVDVEGKTVFVLVNDPGWGNHNPELFDGRAMTYYGRWTYKYEECARQGAAACFVVHETPGAGYGWNVVHTGWSGPQFALPLTTGSPPVVPVAGWITTDAARRLFAAAGFDFDKLKASADYRKFEAVPLGASASLTLHSRIEKFQSDNVLAILPGSEAPDEAIIYTAHWDHLGSDPDLEGDQIYNGAIDNGTGLAAILEIAGAFAAREPAPRRSVLFTAVTLEESGLLGSQYYVQHPVIPLATTVADINIDALPITAPAHDMIVVGYGNSELDNLLAVAVAAQGRHLTPDPKPEQGGYFRSDHLNFAKAGVPSLYAKGGNDLIDGGLAAGRAAARDYNRHHYHSPADNFNPDWDFRGVIQDVRALYAVGFGLASSDNWPYWAPDSAFRDVRRQTAEQRQ